MLVSWPDVQYPQGLLYGLPAVATSWPCGVFPQQEVEPIPLDMVFTGWQRHNPALVRTLKPGNDDVFLLEQSCKDADRGFSTQPMRKRDLLSVVIPRLIPRCVIAQSSGKQRIIDNADQGGQTEYSADFNKLVLCSPLRPAQHIQATMATMTAAQQQLAAQTDAWETGGEDWPDAYRHSHA